MGTETTERNPQENPQVGDGATFIIATDMAAFTVVEVSNGGRRVVIQEDTKTRTDSNGMCDVQSYSFKRNTDGRLRVVTRRVTPHGVVWKERGHRTGSPGCYANIGFRDAYYDYSF